MGKMLRFKINFEEGNDLEISQVTKGETNAEAVLHFTLKLLLYCLGRKLEYSEENIHLSYKMTTKYNLFYLSSFNQV